MYETHVHPARDERSLTRHDLPEQRQVRILIVRAARVVPLDHIVGEDFRARCIPPSGEIFKRPHAHVTRGDSRDDGARQQRFAPHGLACGYRGE